MKIYLLHLITAQEAKHRALEIQSERNGKNYDHISLELPTGEASSCTLRENEKLFSIPASLRQQQRNAISTHLSTEERPSRD